MTTNSKYFEPMAISVASGSTVLSASQHAGCSDSHAYRIASTPEFQVRVSAIRSEATSQAVGRLSHAAHKAVAALELLLDSEEPKDRLNAAKAILATLAPLSEFGELRARIDKLESSSLRI